MKTEIKTKHVLGGLIAGFHVLGLGVLSVHAQTATLTDEWTFNEASGSTANNTVASRPNGTLSAGASFVSGESGNAVRLPPYESVNFGNSVANFGTDDFSISFSIKTVGDGTSSTTAASVLGNRGGYGSCGSFTGFRMGINGQLQFGVSGNTACTGLAFVGGLPGGPAVNDGEWHQVLARRTGASISLYIDCELVGTSTAGDGQVANIQSPFDFVAGANQNTTTFGLDFDGMIDNLRIFSAVVSCDSDGDGVPDDEDNCPNSNTNTTVMIDECDTGLPSDTVIIDGCNLSDMIDALAANAKNHGAFVSSVAGLAKVLNIKGKPKGALMKCAAQAVIPIP